MRCATSSAICLLVVYLAFLTRTYYWDGVLFSLNIESVQRGELSGAALFHPNHLLYSALGYVLYSAALRCGFDIRAITVLQIFNVLASVAAACVLYVFSKRVTGSGLVALFSSVLFAAGATWWKFSTDANSYIIAVFLVLLATMFALGEPARILAAAACHVGAMLFHELAIFTYAPILAAIALDAGRSKRARAGISVAYVVGTSLCVVAAYLFCYAQADRRVYPSLWRWVTSFSSDSGFTHSARQIVGPYLASYGKLFVGGRLIFIRDYFSAILCVALCISIGGLVWAVYLFRRRNSDGARSIDPRITIVLWTWLLAYAIFLAAWGPGSAFYKLFVWPAIMLLIAVYVARTRALYARRKALLVLAVAIAAWNFGVFIYPHSHASADPVLTLAQRVDRELPKNATVYYNVLDPDDWYLEYFAPGRRWLQLSEGETEAQSLARSAAGPVCLETTALARIPSDTKPQRSWSLVNRGHNIRLECWRVSE